MMKRDFLRISLLAFIPLLAACSDENSAVEMPAPIAMTEEAVGHYCNMNILEHTGPKAQIHLENIQHPIWFSQVRDAVAFLRLPEETQVPVAIYVNDMGRSTEWDFPGDDTWIDINEAHLVINSTKTGGMGAPEVVPFSSIEAAGEFVKLHGGNIVQLDKVPDDYVLGPVELKPQMRTITGSVQ